jgi:hypothetical protein
MTSPDSLGLPVGWQTETSEGRPSIALWSPSECTFLDSRRWEKARTMIALLLYVRVLLLLQCHTYIVQQNRVQPKLHIYEPEGRLHVAAASLLVPLVGMFEVSL